MTIMKLSYLFALSLSILGCATVTGTQAECFSKNLRFSDAAACMRAEMGTLKWSSNAPLPALRDYEVYMGLIESKVNKGEMSDEDAKIQMQEYLVRLRSSY